MEPDIDSTLVVPPVIRLLICLYDTQVALASTGPFLEMPFIDFKCPIQSGVESGRERPHALKELPFCGESDAKTYYYLWRADIKLRKNIFMV